MFKAGRKATTPSSWVVKHYIGVCQLYLSGLQWKGTPPDLFPIPSSLANCTTSIPAACTVPNNTANFTLLNTCKTTYKAIQVKNAECLALRTDGAAACSCWGAAANMTTAAKRLSPPCDSQAASKKLKKMKDSCLAAFRVCKKAEDSSVGYIMACSSSSSSSSANSTTTGNSTASGRQLLERSRREVAARLGISGMGSF